MLLFDDLYRSGATMNAIASALYDEGDRESVGTLMNVHRLVQRRKKVVVYVAPDREFVDLKAEPDWDRFVARCPDDLRTRIEKEAVGERNGDAGPRQARLL